MPKPEITIRKAEERDYPFILKLNEADVEVLSPLDRETLDRMANLSEMFQVAEVDGEVAAFQIVFRERSDYWSDNYKWFCERYEKLLYVDRIVVGAAYRKLGLGRRLYETVFEEAKNKSVPFVTAEIDIKPIYNEASIAFHEKMGFCEVGTKLYRDVITVSLQVRKILE